MYVRFAICMYNMYIHVCMHVRMYIGTYGCMYVCMRVCTHGSCNVIRSMKINYLSVIIHYSLQLKPLKLAEILKEKLKQIIQCNNENLVRVLQIHEVEITI